MELFSKKNKEIFLSPLGLNNPVSVQVLGICSALAVTSKLEPALVMGLSVVIITAFSNVIISLLRKTIPNRIRIIVQLVVYPADKRHKCLEKCEGSANPYHFSLFHILLV